MKLLLVIGILFAVLMATATDAADAASDSLLARMFSPILILTEDTGGKYGDIRVIQPEPVDIVSAQFADSIRFDVYNNRGQKLGSYDWRSLDNWDPLLIPLSIDFSQNRFAFLFHRDDRAYKYTGKPLLKGRQYGYGQYYILPLV